MKTERELFEEWISTKDWIYVGMGDRKAKEILVFDNDYQAYHFRSIQESWESWQASAQREGYKLAPVEPTKEMIKAYHDTLSFIPEKLYKAMIGAAP